MATFGTAAHNKKASGNSGIGIPDSGLGTEFGSWDRGYRRIKTNPERVEGVPWSLLEWTYILVGQ